MIQPVNLLVFLHGFLTFHTEGALDLTAENSDSYPGYRRSYYVVQMLPIQRLKGKPENIFDRNTADLLTMLASGIFGAPRMINPTANMVARSRLQPASIIHPKQNPPTLAPSLLESITLKSRDLTLSTQSKILERNGKTSNPGNPVTYFSTSARFSPTPQILTILDLPQRGALHSTNLLTNSATEEPRGDM